MLVFGWGDPDTVRTVHWSACVEPFATGIGVWLTRNPSQPLTELLFSRRNGPIIHRSVSVINTLLEAFDSTILGAFISVTNATGPLKHRPLQ